MNTIKLTLSHEELAAAMAAAKRGDDALLLLRSVGAAEPEQARQRLIAAGNGLVARGLALTGGGQVSLGPDLREIVAAITGASTVVRMVKTGTEGDADSLTLSSAPAGWLVQRSGGNWGVQCQMPIDSAELPALMVQFLAPVCKANSSARLPVPAALLDLDAKQRRIPAALWNALGEQRRGDPLAGQFIQAMVQARWRAAIQMFFPSAQQDVTGYGVLFVQGPEDLWIIEGQPANGDASITAYLISLSDLKELFAQKINQLPRVETAVR